MKKYLSTFISCFIITLFSTLYIKSVAEHNIMMAMTADLIVPLLSVGYYHYLIEEKTIWGKIKIALVSGIAYAVGTGVMLLLL